MILVTPTQKNNKTEVLTLLSLGTHENFYRDLKK